MTNALHVGDVVVDPRTGNFAKGWLRNIDYLLSAVLIQSNGETGGEIRRVESGTPMGRITSGNKVRPAMVGVIDGAQVGVNEIVMAAGQTENFRVGDVVSLLEADGVTVTVSGRSITVITPATPSITIDGATVTTEDLGSLQGEDGSQDAFGFLLSAAQTADGIDEDGNQLFADQGVSLVVRGVVEEDQLTGSNTIIKADLVGDITFL